MPHSIGHVQYITLAEACKLIPGRPHVNTVRRWCDRGYNNAVLSSWRFAGKRVTTLAAIDAFFAQTSSADSTAARAPDSHAAAEKKLDAMGVNADSVRKLVTTKNRR